MSSTKDDSEEKRGRGAPKVDIDWARLDAYASLKLPLQACADLITLSTGKKLNYETLKKRIQNDFGMTWGEYQESRLAPTKAKLIQTAIEMALKKDRTMLIFCLKNICGWTDKQEVTTFEQHGLEIKLSYKINEDSNDIKINEIEIPEIKHNNE